MKPHHERAVSRLKDKYENDVRFLALIIVGSVAGGTARDESDVDHILVATDDEFARRLSGTDIHYSTPDLCDYPGGYVEGKIVDLGFIREAVARGSEPARSQFAGACVVFTKIPGLAELVKQAAAYPENERGEKIRTFYAHLKVLRDYLSYGEQKNDRYIILRASSGMALFAGRLILAHNRILYPYHKWFLQAVRNAPDKPPHFMEFLDAFLERPTSAAGDALCDCLVDFMHLKDCEKGFISRFVIDTEWNWRHGRGPVEDW